MKCLSSAAKFAARVSNVLKPGRHVSIAVLSALASLALATTVSAGKPRPPDSAPSNLTATAVSSSQINLAWDRNSTSITGFKIERANSSSGPWSEIAIVAADRTWYNDTGLPASSTRYYRVRSYDRKYNSNYSNIASATTQSAGDTTAPSVPTGLTASAASSSQINLNWNAATDTGGSGLAGYKVYRGGVQIATAASTSYSNTGLNAGTQYCYTVAAYDNAGNTSGQGSQACATTQSGGGTAPTAPNNLVATGVSSSQINLTWSDNSANETGFHILRWNPAVAAWQQIAAVGANATSYPNTGLSASTTYYYLVRAYNGTGESANSNLGIATTLAGGGDTTAPSTPTGLSASAVSSSQINLSWNASSDTGGSGLAGYKVYRAGAQIGTTASTSYSNTGLSPSTAYCYTVAAYDNAGNTSSQSSQACATTQGGADTTNPTATMTAPANGSVVKGTITLSANASDNVGVTKVEFYRDSGVLIGTDTSSPYSVGFNTTTVSSGTHNFYAKAYDAANNTGTSATILLTVDNTMPSASLVSPGSGSTVSGTITVSANASDNVAVARVDFYRDGSIFLGSDTAAPYSISHSTAGVSDGTHTYHCMAVDTANNAATSPANSVTVNNGTIPGEYQWSWGFGGSLLADNAYAEAVAADPSGNVFVGGFFTYSVDFGGVTLTALAPYSDVFLAKYSASGQYLWAKRFGSTGSDGAMRIVTDASGNAIVSGYFSGTIQFDSVTLTSHGSWDVFVAKFSPSGTCLWAKSFGGIGAESAEAVALDSAGNVYLTGWYESSFSFGGSALPTFGGRDVFVAKLSSSGAHLWSKGMGAAGYDYSYDVAVDSSGNAVIAGSFVGTINFGGASLTSVGADVFVAKFTASTGGHVWSKSFGSSADQMAYGVAVDGSGNVFVTGTFSDTINLGGGTFNSNSGTAIFLAKLSSAGAHVWSKSFGGGLYTTTIGNSVATDDQDNVLLTGGASGTINFGGSWLFASSPDGYTDAVLAKFANDGTHLWSKRFGGVGRDIGEGVAADGQGNVFITGQFDASIDFGGGLQPSTGGTDGFLAKFAP